MRTTKLLAALLSLAVLGPGAARAAPKGSPWGESYFPNYVLTTQDGKQVKLYDDLIRDKMVVFSFIYTRCNKQCGLIAASMARVQRELEGRLGKDIFFYSISIDPERDTPEVLKRYAEAFHARPGWTFLTGKKEEIKVIRQKFGDLAPVEEHTANLRIGNDRTGQWMATGAVDNPKYLAMVIGDWLDPSWDKRPPRKSYTAAPTTEQLLKLSRGALLYRDNCLACHSADESVGPSLKGVVARRDPRWLARWIKEPDKMLAEQDALAVQLLEKYAGVPMPNTGLSDEQVAAVVEHLRQADLAAAARAAPEVARGEGGR